MESKVLHLVLKKKWFDLIESGEKTIEYREVKPYWTKRLIGKFNLGDEIRFYCGYSKDRHMTKKTLIGIDEIENGLETDLKVDKPVYCIYFE